jgi:hypothetical protein
MAGKEKHFNKVSEVSNQITIQAVKQRDEAVQSQKNSELLIERQAQEIKQLSTDYKTKVIDEAKTVRSVRGTMPTTGTGYPRTYDYRRRYNSYQSNYGGESDSEESEGSE